ncbi:c-type cytochrome [Novosphingobium aureum]|uniref:c-type cytochrome n=1 Tax=Novosphingobium aureum TaxID=2792964 RepID=UPI001E2A5879|nr:c-type cytochrome [Novosphingobium aureum]
MRSQRATGVATFATFAILGPALLGLAACSGEPDTPEAVATETAAALASEPAVASEAASEPVASEAAPEASPEPSATPSASATTQPEPKPEPKPSPSPTKAAAPAPAQVPVAAAEPPKSFARCAVCHNATKGAGDKLGPNLYGTFGHPMGQGSFAFSDALKNSGLTMDEATLDKWLENPRALVPGNRMSFPGLKDAAKRKEIIEYLKQQR